MEGHIVLCSMQMQYVVYTVRQSCLRTISIATSHGREHLVNFILFSLTNKINSGGFDSVGVECANTSTPSGTCEFCMASMHGFLEGGWGVVFSEIGVGSYW